MKPVWWAYNAKTGIGRYTEHPYFYQSDPDWTLTEVVLP